MWSFFRRLMPVSPPDLLQGYETSAQISAIEDLIAQAAPIQLVLRLLCLANVTTGGIKVKTLENIKREILQASCSKTSRKSFLIFTSPFLPRHMVMPTFPTSYLYLPRLSSPHFQYQNPGPTAKKRPSHPRLSHRSARPSDFFPIQTKLLPQMSPMSTRPTLP